MKDYADGWYVTKSTTIKDHGKKCHITDETVMQQQLENSEPAGKFIILEGQDYEMINIKELINNWLEKAI